MRNLPNGVGPYNIGYILFYVVTVIRQSLLLLLRHTVQQTI